MGVKFTKCEIYGSTVHLQSFCAKKVLQCSNVVSANLAKKKSLNGFFLVILLDLFCTAFVKQDN